MISFEDFVQRYRDHSQLELLRMTYKLATSFERILMSGGDRDQRAKSAEAILRAHGG